MAPSATLKDSLQKPNLPGPESCCSGSICGWFSAGKSTPLCDNNLDASYSLFSLLIKRNMLCKPDRYCLTAQSYGCIYSDSPDELLRMILLSTVATYTIRDIV